ncbi:MAG: HAD-IIIA family hydrolase [Bacteroidia bacterium]|nr:HAD-IIIA family hydrolase [Bacteroidia bacterium]
MKELKAYLPNRTECKEFTLFLDRDGVINEPIVDDYAKKPDDFVICKGALQAIKELKNIFRYVILVTNQQGIHRELMSEKDLENVHLKLHNAMKLDSIPYFDLALFAPYLRTVNNSWRKPSTGMLLQAKEYLKDINFKQSIMVGDSPSDMVLADNVGAVKVRIENPQFSFDNQDFKFDSLSSFAKYFT